MITNKIKKTNYERLSSKLLGLGLLVRSILYEGVFRGTEYEIKVESSNNYMNKDGLPDVKMNSEKDK